MTAISQALKAGLAAGVIYGLMIGLLDLSTLLGCSGAQIQHIASSPLLPSNATATDYFYGTDIVYYPMITGIFTLVIAVFFGVIFAFAYRRLPGLKSSSKGLGLGVGTFLCVAFLGPGYFVEYTCTGSALPSIPYLTFALSFPAALVFGYLLGSFYDSFGRLEAEETEERRKSKEPEHWSEYFKRKPSEDVAKAAQNKDKSYDPTEEDNNT